MDIEAVTGLLKAIRDAVSTTQQKDDDIALPLFDPDKNDCGAKSWCDSIETLRADLKWSSIKTAAKAGKALKGSALIWFDSWQPSEGRSWEKFCIDIIDAYPEKKNLSERLAKAVLFTSDSSDSYSEYAREKMRLLRNTKISFTDEQLIELVCGGITDVDVKMASLNNGVTTTAALISLLSVYVKSKKRPLENTDSGSIGNKRPRPMVEKKCFTCNQVGHIQLHCPKNKQMSIRSSPTSQPSSKPSDSRPKIFCTFCKKPGHSESICYHKQRAESSNSSSITIVPSKEVNFLGKPN